MPLEEDDPVIASYNVYISPPPSQKNETTTTKNPSQLYMLQYPSHRPSNRPYNTSRLQKPTFVRLRPNTGIIEVDVPILTSDNYNQPLGSQFGKAMQESHLNHPNSTHGLSGGFSHHTSTTTTNSAMNLADIPHHGSHDNPSTLLSTQTLAGKISTTSDKDPIYMLATLHQPRGQQSTKQLHLQHLDAVVQLRPQLHHIDAAEELKKRAETVAARAKSFSSVANNVAGAAGTGAGDGQPPKLETKAIELKLKDTSKDDPKDRHQNENARLLREIQNDRWVRYEWVEAPGGSTLNNNNVASGLAGSNAAGVDEAVVRPATLRATLDNDEWLNRISSPGIELRTRLKGRDRERARRKRQERARISRERGGGVPGGGGISVAVTTSVTAGRALQGQHDDQEQGELTESDLSDDDDEDMDDDTNEEMDDDEEEEAEDNDMPDVQDTARNIRQSTMAPPLPLPPPTTTSKRKSTRSGSGTTVRPAQTAPRSPEVQIKQESSGPTVPLSAPQLSQSATPAPKRRGRPPKAK